MYIEKRRFIYFVKKVPRNATPLSNFLDSFFVSLAVLYVSRLKCHSFLYVIVEVVGSFLCILMLFSLSLSYIWFSIIQWTLRSFYLDSHFKNFIYLSQIELKARSVHDRTTCSDLQVQSELGHEILGLCITRPNFSSIPNWMFFYIYVCMCKDLNINVSLHIGKTQPCTSTFIMFLYILA